MKHFTHDAHRRLVRFESPLVLCDRLCIMRGVGIRQGDQEDWRSAGKASKVGLAVKRRPNAKFWTLFNMGGHDSQRWMCNSVDMCRLQNRLFMCIQMSDWIPPVIHCDPPHIFEDVLIQTDVYSSRAKQVFEEVAPGHAQFLPVTLRSTDGADLSGAGEYWVANWLNLVDCFDEARSECLRDDATNEILSVMTLVIDETRVPENVVVFRCARASWKLVVRPVVKRALVKAKIGMAAFYRLRTTQELAAQSGLVP